MGNRAAKPPGAVNYAPPTSPKQKKRRHSVDPPSECVRPQSARVAWTTDAVPASWEQKVKSGDSVSQIFGGPIEVPEPVSPVSPQSAKSASPKSAKFRQSLNTLDTKRPQQESVSARFGNELRPELKAGIKAYEEQMSDCPSSPGTVHSPSSPVSPWADGVYDKHASRRRRSVDATPTLNCVTSRRGGRSVERAGPDSPKSAKGWAKPLHRGDLVSDPDSPKSAKELRREADAARRFSGSTAASEADVAPAAPSVLPGPSDVPKRPEGLPPPRHRQSISDPTLFMRRPGADEHPALLRRGSVAGRAEDLERERPKDLKDRDKKGTVLVKAPKQAGAADFMDHIPKTAASRRNSLAGRSAADMRNEFHKVHKAKLDDGAPDCVPYKQSGWASRLIPGGLKKRNRGVRA